MSTRPASRAGSIDFPAAAQLPVYLTPLVGRSREVGEVSGLLRTSRLVSLVGAGGSGKTRLAAAVAAELRDRPRGDVAWVDLAPLADPELVVHHTAATLGIHEQPDRAMVEALVEVIGRRSALLVLDNCEHVLRACTLLADSLLRGCPALRILTTSRQALGLAGEKAWLVPPLALPGPGDSAVEEAGAVQLFVQRASDVLPSFSLTEANTTAVVGICRRLDGLPLAIELAAARVKLLPPEQLARRLDSVFRLLSTSSQLALPRHRTLRALIDWSYDLLSAEERLLFARLAIFSGGFSLEAAESIVICDGLDRVDVLDLLAALVDKSLVSMREWHGEARYSLRETVRQYAQERLASPAEEGGAGDGLERLRLRHARFFAALAERAAVQLHGRAQCEWLDRLDVDHDNVRSALAWSVAAPDAELALRLCTAMRDYWRSRGHLSEGRRWLEEALRLPGQPAALRARALACAAVLGRMQGEHGAFREHLAESEALARRIGDREALADALTQRGVDLRERCELEAAREQLDEAVSVWRELGEARGLSLALGVRASIALFEGEVALARALRLEAVEVSRRAGDREGEALGLIGLGEVSRLEGDSYESRAYNERCLALFLGIGDTWHAAAVYQNLGWLAVESGALEEAHAAFSESVALFRVAGNPFGLTLCLFGFARLLHELGDSASGAIALAAAASYATRVGVMPAAPADLACCARTRSVVEGGLDEESFARAWNVGARMELAEGLAWAQEKLATPRLAQAEAGPRTAASDPPEPAAAPARTAPAAPAELRRHPEPDGAATADLRVRALGPLQVFVAGRPLDGEAFGSSKPRELLLLLLCHPEGRTREQVGLAFWPESSAAQVKNSFHVTLHRLRKALGHPEWIVAAGDHYRLDPALRIDFDAARFEAGVEAALRASGTAADAGDRLAAALALYEGEFLEGEMVGDWHLEIRDRLRRLHLDGLLARGRLLMEAERYAEAAGAFRAALARDRLHEEACRQLMICHARTGERARALRLYETLAVLLREELDTAPDEATTLLHERLQRTESV
jgi:predicted ATPase/DNA-binding SARP family transcriptional activator